MNNQNTALNQSVDLISTKGLDEMQTEQAYKTAFNCFKAFYWGNAVIATLLLIGSVLSDMELTLAYAFAVIGIIMIVFTSVIIVFTSVIYVIFAAKTAKQGAMNPQFLKVASSPQKIFSMTMICILYIIFTFVNHIGDNISLTFMITGFMTILYISHMITYFMARKSLKLMNSQTEEE